MYILVNIFHLKLMKIISKEKPVSEKNQIRLKEIESFFAAFRMHNNTIHEEKCVAFCHLEK